MKHEAFFRRLMPELYEDWMNDDDKEFMVSEMISRYGKLLDQSIEVGIKNGFSVEQQEDIVRYVFRWERGKIEDYLK